MRRGFGSVIVLPKQVSNLEEVRKKTITKAVRLCLDKSISGDAEVVCETLYIGELGALNKEHIRGDI